MFGEGFIGLFTLLLFRAFFLGRSVFPSVSLPFCSVRTLDFYTVFNVGFLMRSIVCSLGSRNSSCLFQHPTLPSYLSQHPTRCSLTGRFPFCFARCYPCFAPSSTCSLFTSFLSSLFFLSVPFLSIFISFVFLFLPFPLFLSPSLLPSYFVCLRLLIFTM